MSNIPQHGRGLAFNLRAMGVVGLSFLVFLLSMKVGLVISSSGNTTHQVITVTTGEASTPTSTTSRPQAEVDSDDGKWNLVASASAGFTDTSVDRNVWGVYEGLGNAGVGLRRASALHVKDGVLEIRAQGKVSGGLSQHFGQTYGRWTMKARMEAGQGYGPALLLWPDSEKWPEDGEIDFLELPAANRDKAIMTTHWGVGNSQVSKSVDGDYTQWHTFTIDWLPDHLAFFIDGVEQWRVTDPKAIPTKPMHLALQNDVGACGSWIGCTNSTTPKTVSLFVSDVQVYSPAS